MSKVLSLERTKENRNFLLFFSRLFVPLHHKKTKQTINNTMAKKEKEKKLNAKQKAYAKKQEEGGKKVVAWIIGVFVARAVFYVAYLAITA